jgi:hypothetical protein
MCHETLVFIYAHGNSFDFSISFHLSDMYQKWWKWALVYAKSVDKPPNKMEEFSFVLNDQYFDGFDVVFHFLIPVFASAVWCIALYAHV